MTLSTNYQHLYSVHVEMFVHCSSATSEECGNINKGVLVV